MKDALSRELQALITDSARRLEVELKGNAEELKDLGVELLGNLALALGEPGYEEAVEAARDILALELGIEAVELADAADSELRGIIFGFLVTAVNRL